MPQQDDTTDFLTAFAIGTALGVGATLLLRPRPKSARERLMRELRPGRGRLRGTVPADAVRVRRAEPAEAAEADGLTEEEVIDVGRELLEEFREEVQRILADAREQLRHVAEGSDELDAEAEGLADRQ